MKFDLGKFSIIKKIGELPQRYILLCILLAASLMSANLLVKINRFAVNILFSDQWDTYQPTFNGDNSWRIFTAQVGQLRLGIGGLFSDFIARATDWNTRAECFAIGFTMVLISIAAVYLKYRLFQKLSLWDLIIPFVCLSVGKMDVPILVPFPSHSTMPVLLLILYAICLTFDQTAIRIGLLAVINFLAIFTGWGIFVGFITPFVLIYFFLQNRKTENEKDKIWIASAFVFSVLSLVFYFNDYTVYSGVECFTLPHYPLTDYWKFFALMLSNSVGFGCGRKVYLSFFLGTVVFAAFIFTAIVNLWKILRRGETGERNLNLIIVVLLTFSGLFIATATVGRTCLGECTAAAGRYQPLLIPAWLAVYFAFVTLKENRVRFAAGFLLIVFCFIIPQSRDKAYQVSAEINRDIKNNWKACYLATEDAEECDRKVGTSIFAPLPSIRAKDRFEYLKQRRLNFFSDK